MSGVQFYLTIGIPTLAVLLGVLMNVVQFHSIIARFSGQDARFSSIDASFNSIEARFNSVDARFNNLAIKFDTLIGKIVELDNRVTRIEAKLDIHKSLQPLPLHGKTVSMERLYRVTNL